MRVGWAIVPRDRRVLLPPASGTDRRAPSPRHGWECGPRSSCAVGTGWFQQNFARFNREAWRRMIVILDRMTSLDSAAHAAGGSGGCVHDGERGGGAARPGERGGTPIGGLSIEREKRWMRERHSRDYSPRTRGGGAPPRIKEGTRGAQSYRRGETIAERYLTTPIRPELIGVRSATGNGTRRVDHTTWRSGRSRGRRVPRRGVASAAKLVHAVQDGSGSMT